MHLYLSILSTAGINGSLDALYDHAQHASNYEQGPLEQRVQADAGVLVFLLQSNHIWLHCVRALEKIKRFQRINEDSPLGGAIHTGRFPAPGLADTSKYPSDLVKPYYSQSYRSHAV